MFRASSAIERSEAQTLERLTHVRAHAIVIASFVDSSGKGSADRSKRFCGVPEERVASLSHPFVIDRGEPALLRWDIKFGEHFRKR